MRRSHTSALVTGLLAGTLALPTVAAAAPTFKAVVLNGDAAPDSEGPFIRFGEPALNNNGTTLFGAVTGTTPFSADEGLFTVDSGGNTGLVIGSGPNAPDTGGAFFIGPRSWSLNDAGDIAFEGALGNSGSGIFKTSGGATTLLARNNDSARSGGFNLSSVSRPVLDDDGVTAFEGRLNDGSATSAIFRESNGGLQALATAGDSGPDGAEYVVVRDPALSGAGDIAFSAFLDPTSGTDGDNFGGIVRESGGELSLFARTGDEAPGTEEGLFRAFGAPVLNAGDGIAFLGAYRETGATSSTRGLFADTGSGLGIVAQEGDLVPGLEEVMLDLFGDYALNDDGDIAFASQLGGSGATGAGDDALFFKPNGGPLELILRVGDGLEGFGTLRDFSLIDNGGFLNNGDQIAFSADLSEQPEGPITTRGIFIASLDDSGPTVSVPAPGSLVLLGGGLACLALFSRRLTLRCLRWPGPAAARQSPHRRGTGSPRAAHRW